MPLEGERAQRIIVAVLQNISNWEDRMEAVVDCCPPGCKSDALSLLRDMTMAKRSLRRLAGIGDE